MRGVVGVVSRIGDDMLLILFYTSSMFDRSVHVEVQPRGQAQGCTLANHESIGRGCFPHEPRCALAATYPRYAVHVKDAGQQQRTMGCDTCWLEKCCHQVIWCSQKNELLDTM